MAAGLIIIAAVDAPIQLWESHKKLLMTKQEVRDEHKDQEGRPEVKQRIRQTQREMSQRRMMAAIPDARVTFQSQSGGFSGRDITFVIGGDDPVALEKHARLIVSQMEKLKEVRAPRIEGDIPRPEIIVTPRLDLAAELNLSLDLARLPPDQQPDADALGRRLVVVRGDQQGSVGADFLSGTGQLDRLTGGVATGAGNYRDAAIDLVNHATDDLDVLADFQGRRLAGSTDRDDGVGAFLQVEVHQFAQAVPVEMTLCIHGCDQCHHTARNHATAPAGKREP